MIYYIVAESPEHARKRLRAILKANDPLDTAMVQEPRWALTTALIEAHASSHIPMSQSLYRIESDTSTGYRPRTRMKVYQAL